MERIRTDVCIIGAGAGGLAVAAGAVQMGARVVLLEGGRMGGDCLNHGCVPSKALLAAAKQAHAMGAGAPFGVAPAVPRVDYAAAMEHVARVIGTIAPHDSQERFEGMGVRVIREYGRFVSRREVRAGDAVIAARRFVIATGSSPLVPPIPGLEDVPFLTSETLFELRERPGHLLIIGAGAIGLEMAQAHRRLGSRVTVIEGAAALGRDDPELAAVVLKRLREEGVEIVERAPAAAVRGTSGAIEVETAGGRTFRGSHLLVAVGRRANIDRLGLGAAGIEAGRTITVDAGLRTTNRRVYAIGDVAGALQFTHVAGYHAGVIIRSMLFALPSKVRTDHIPRVTYTDPELAQAGLTEAEALREYGEEMLEVVRFPYAGNDRAIAGGQSEGLIKVMVFRGRPVGASIVGAQAGELIGLWALALANRMKMSQIAAMVAPYPTLGELGKRAAGAYFSPRLFDSAGVKRVVRLVQKFLP